MSLYRRVKRKIDRSIVLVVYIKRSQAHGIAVVLVDPKLKSITSKNTTGKSRVRPILKEVHEIFSKGFARINYTVGNFENILFLAIFFI